MSVNPTKELIREAEETHNNIIDKIKKLEKNIEMIEDFLSNYCGHPYDDYKFSKMEQENHG